MNIQNRIKELRYIPATELKANPKNWRKHPTAQQKMLKTMFKEVGYVDALIGRELDDGSIELIDGHLRQEMSGNQDVPVLILDVTQEEADLILASFDPITGMADTDKSLMKELLQSIDSDDADVSAMLDKLAKDANVDLYDDQPEPEARIEIADELQAKWQTELGQLWQVGKHRILCGDCTDSELVALLMDGKKADMVFTDPPYNVDYTSNVNAKRLGILNDSMTASAYNEFCQGIFRSIKSVCADYNSIYICGSDSSLIPYYAINGLKLSSIIVWVKDRLVLGGKDYQAQTELIFYGWIGKHRWYGNRKQTTAWRIDGPKSSKLHPTMKPIEIMVKAINNSSAVGGVVFDLFLGSHSTMVAAEQTGRICHGMELDPKYVAVGLERMSEMGLKPELVNG